MQERERPIVTGLILLLVVLTLGFFVHRDPRFPGSLTGGVLGISAAALMLVPLVYLFIKRIPPLKRAVTPAVSMRTLLAIHIYAGVLAPILGILHSGHKFQSPLGIALTTMMVIVALSGVVGRFLYVRLHADLRGEKATLAGLRGAMSNQHQAADTRLQGMPGVLEALHAFERDTLDAGPKQGARHLWRLFVLPIQRQRVAQQCKAEVKQRIKQGATEQAHGQKWSKTQAVARYRACCAQVDDYAMGVKMPMPASARARVSPRMM